MKMRSSNREVLNILKIPPILKETAVYPATLKDRHFIKDNHFKKKIKT
jgi:hypothetical protein